MGAKQLLNNLYKFLQRQTSESVISDLCTWTLLMWRSLQLLSDPEISDHYNSPVKCWHLCQKLPRLLWQWWCTGYLQEISDCSFGNWRCCQKLPRLLWQWWCTGYLQCFQKFSKWRSETLFWLLEVLLSFMRIEVHLNNGRWLVFVISPGKRWNSSCDDMKWQYLYSPCCEGGESSYLNHSS